MSNSESVWVVTWSEFISRTGIDSIWTTELDAMCRFHYLVKRSDGEPHHYSNRRWDIEEWTLDGAGIAV